MTIALLRLLPPEWAHAIAIWSLRTGTYRIGLWIDWGVCRCAAYLLMCYAKPVGFVLRG